MAGLFVSTETRNKFKPQSGYLNISMDFNASESGGARGTEVVIPDDAGPEVRAAAEKYNRLVAEFARANGISDYPIRGVRTRSENKRGVSHTVHAEPFFNDDLAMQEAIKNNPAAFAAIYEEAFGSLPSARLIAPHGVGKDRGAASPVFGDETSFGEFMANSLLGNPSRPLVGQPLPTRGPIGSGGSDMLAGQAGGDPMAGPPDIEGLPAADAARLMLQYVQSLQQPAPEGEAAAPEPEGLQVPEFLNDITAEQRAVDAANSRDIMGAMQSPMQPRITDGSVPMPAPGYAPPEKPFFDIAQDLTGPSRDLLNATGASIMGQGPSVSAGMLPEGLPGRQGFGRALDFGLAGLGGLGLAYTGAVGGIADVAEAAGVPRAAQLGRDLAGMPDAFAGSPGALATPATRAPSMARPVARVERPSAQPPLGQGMRRAADDVAVGVADTSILPAAEQNKVRELIARAAGGNSRARQDLAEMARINPEAAAAAERLNIDVPVDVFSDTEAVRQAAGLVRSVRGSDAAVEWGEKLEAAKARAAELMGEGVSTLDVSVQSESVRTALAEGINELRTLASPIYDEVAAAIPVDMRVVPSNARKEIDRIVAELGGSDALTKAERQVFEALQSGDGITYARLQRLREDIGRAAFKGSGPYADANERTMRRLYAILNEDQGAFVEAVGGEALLTRWNQAQDLWAEAKDIEDRLVAGFGKDAQGSIAQKLQSAFQMGRKGNITGLNNVMAVIPDDMRKDALLSGLYAVSKDRAGVGFSFAQYAKMYRGLRDNSEVYGKIAKAVGPETEEMLRSLYEVSARMSRADANISRTGQSLQAFLGESVLERVINSSVGGAARAGTGAALGGGIGALMGGGIGAGIGGTVGAATGASLRVSNTRAKAVSALFRDPAFQRMAIEAARGDVSERAQRALLASGAFRRWAKSVGVTDPQAWILGLTAERQAQQDD